MLENERYEAKVDEVKRSQRNKKNQHKYLEYISIVSHEQKQNQQKKKLNENVQHNGLNGNKRDCKMQSKHKNI